LLTVPVSVSVSDLEANPHDLHARCREEHPVVYVPELDAFLVTRWDDVRAVCSESAAVSSAQPNSSPTRLVGPNMLHSEGVNHRLARAAVLPAFRQPPASLDDAWTQVSEALPTNGVVDLLACGVEPLVSQALVHLLGLGAWVRNTRRGVLR